MSFEGKMDKKNQRFLWPAAIILGVGILVVCIGIFGGYSNGCHDKSCNNNDSSGISGLRKPDEMIEIAKDSNVEWMSGIWVDLPECEREEPIDETIVDTYICQEKRISATVVLQNGLDLTQPYYLLILADGVPTNFTIEEETFTKYSLMLSNQQTTLNIKLEPTFCNDLGRLDFLLFYDGNPLSDFHMTGYTVHLISDYSDSYTSLCATNLRDTIPQRKGLIGTFNDETYNAWLWNGDYYPSEEDNVGARKLLVDDSSFLFEAVAANPGIYRTILLMDGNPMPFSCDGKSLDYLDWTSEEMEMLQVPIDIDFWGNEKSSFFTVSTPLGDERLSSKNLVSGKIQLSK